MAWMKADTFFSYSEDRITVWNLNRIFTSFTRLSSSVNQIKRVTSVNGPARILSLIDDGSIRLISPVTGSIIRTGLPSMADHKFKFIEYDIKTGI
jgi:hypothetical protein